MASGDYIQARLVSFTENEVGALATASEEEWANTLKAMRNSILNNILQSIPDATRFRDIMLQRALPQYQQFINPNHPKANKAIAKLKAKFADLRTYQQWLEQIQSAFAEGGRFENAIDNVLNTNKYEERVKPVLMMVGGSTLGLGPAPKLVMILRGLDPTSYLRSDIGEQFTDTGVDRPLVDPLLPEYVVAAVVPILVEAVYWHRTYTSVGDSTSADNALSNGQSRLQAFLAKILDSSKFTVNTLSLSYDNANKRYVLELRIDQTA